MGLDAFPVSGKTRKELLASHEQSTLVHMCVTLFMSQLRETTPMSHRKVYKLAFAEPFTSKMSDSIEDIQSEIKGLFMTYVFHLALPNPQLGFGSQPCEPLPLPPPGKRCQSLISGQI